MMHLPEKKGSTKNNMSIISAKKLINKCKAVSLFIAALGAYFLSLNSIMYR